MKRIFLTYAGRGLCTAMVAMTVALMPACVDVNDGGGAFDDFLEVKDAAGNTVNALSYLEEGGEDVLHLTAKGKGWLTLCLTDNTGGDWVYVSPEVAKAGNTTATINIRPNTTSPTERIATYQFQCGEISHDVTITQSAAPVVATGEPTDVEFDRAKLHGSWAYLGDETIEANAYGFKYRVYGTTNWTDIAAGDVTQDPEAGIRAGFEALAGNLDPSKNYEYYAYIVTNERGQIDGPVGVLRTQVDPVLITVQALRAMYVGSNMDITDPTRIHVIVVSDAVGANLPVEDAFLAVDANNPSLAGNGIVILPGASGLPVTYAVGDQLDVVLTNSELYKAGATLAVNAPHRITLIQSGAAPAPIPVSDVTALADYESMLVSVSNTQLLTKFASDPATYSKWSSASAMGMETNGSTVSYLLSVKSGAAFANDAPKTGSGTLTGVVALDAAGDNAIVMPRTAADVSLLAETRFPSLISMQFASVELVGPLFEDMASSAVLRLHYVNGDERTMPGTAFTVTSTVGELTPAPAVGYQIAEGSGYVDIPITGTPAAAGSVTFEVTGITDFALPSPAAATGTIATPTINNFTVMWERPTTHSTSTPASPTNVLGVAANSAYVTGSGIYGNAAWTGGGNWNTSYGGAVAAGNTGTNPVNCLEFTLTVHSAMANLSGIFVPFRLGGRPSSVDIFAYVRYKVGNGSYKTCSTLTTTAVSANGNEYFGTDAATPFDLSGIRDLQGLPKNTVVTFQIIPVTTGCVNFVIEGRDSQSKNSGACVKGTAID